jgi:thiosulfate/3-mercaptopyruvate sulfurtransferase
MRELKLALILFFVLGFTQIPEIKACESSRIIANATPLVSVKWLGEHITHKSLVLLHVGSKSEYDSGHIAGARYISLRAISLPREKGGLALQLPPAETLKAEFEKLGISNDSRIVIYFGKDWITPTTRVYFTLDYLGLKENTSILDGGMPAWVAAGNSLVKDVVSPKSGSLIVNPDDKKVATSEWVEANRKDPTVKIIDARTPNYYDGSKAGRYPRQGHIPGAENIPYSTIVDKRLRFKDDKALKAMFADAGVKPGDTIITYCHIGQQASLAYFAARKLGYTVKLFDGSFEEWSRNKSLYVVGPKAKKTGN